MEREMNIKDKNYVIKEMAIFSDIIVDETAKTCLLKLGVKSNNYSRGKIRHCESCGGKDITSLEVLGVYSGPIFWICRACNNLHLRFTPEFTERVLLKTKGLWSNANDWGDLTKKDPS